MWPPSPFLLIFYNLTKKPRNLLTSWTSFELKDSTCSRGFSRHPCASSSLIFAWCIAHFFAEAVAPDIKQWSYFLSPKKKKGGRCLKSLQLNSYKSALAVVLQRNLCKALLSLNSFAVVGWLSEEQLSSIRHVFLREQSPPTHHTYPPPGGGFW